MENNLEEAKKEFIEAMDNFVEETKIKAEVETIFKEISEKISVSIRDISTSISDIKNLEFNLEVEKTYYDDKIEKLKLFCIENNIETPFIFVDSENKNVYQITKEFLVLTSKINFIK